MKFVTFFLLCYMCILWNTSSVMSQTLVRKYIVNSKSKIQTIMVHENDLYILSDIEISRWNMTDGSFKRSYFLPRTQLTFSIKSELTITNNSIIIIGRFGFYRWDIDSQDGNPVFFLIDDIGYTIYDEHVYSLSSHREIVIRDLYTGIHIQTLHLPIWANDIDYMCNQMITLDNNSIYLQHLKDNNRDSSIYTQQWDQNLAISKRNYTCTKKHICPVFAKKEKLCAVCPLGPMGPLPTIAWNTTSGDKIWSHELCPQNSFLFQIDDKKAYCRSDKMILSISLETGETELEYHCNLSINNFGEWIYHPYFFILEKDLKSITQYLLEPLRSAFLSNNQRYKLLMQQF